MLDDKAIKSKIHLINTRLASIRKTGSKSINRLFKNVQLLNGKRIRGLLVLLASEACGAKTSAYTLNIAAAIEILHHATLIHDDIVDDSEKRRGAFTLNRRLGETYSVLTGDYLFARAMSLILDGRDQALFSIFAGAATDVCEGEIEEVYHKNDAALSMQDCLNIIKKKTASLIAASVASGAHAGKCPETTAKHLVCFGENLGMAFQIKDDLLDIKSKTSKIGKSAGNDIKEGKATLPLILALRNAPAKESGLIKSLFRKKTTAKNIKRIISFILKYKGDSMAGLLALSYVEDAKAALDKAKLKDEKKKELLYRLADYMVEREY